MNIHYIMHVPFEKTGVIRAWASKNGHEFSGTRVYLGEILPDISSVDFLIIMGGPQSAVDLDKHPYLQEEVTLIRHAIDKGKYILGICLGAQLVGIALGAKACRSPYREIGAYPIDILEAGKKDPVFNQLPQMPTVIHWHTDMVALPENAVLLAKSAGCPNQAYRYGDRIYGLQFHLELTRTMAEDLLENCSDDLVLSPYVHSSEEILAADFDQMNQWMHLFLDEIIKR